LLAIPSRPGSEAYTDFVRSWGVLVAGALGLVCILGWRRQFLGRALAAVGIAALIAVIGMAFATHAAGRIEGVFARELQTRNSAVLAQWARGFPNASFAPAIRDWAAQRAVQLQDASGTLAAPLYPALLALESLAACALAWGLYHRMSRARLGAALAPFRFFRFSDELIWALVAGMTLTILPSLEALRVFGANLVVFFGALYALRGFGVIAWFYPQLTLGTQLAASVIAVVLFPVSLALAVGLGRHRYVVRLAAARAHGGSPAGPTPPDSSLEDQPFDRSIPMEVILKQAIDNLGQPGDIVMVSPGYGRNFLLPRGLAYEATPGNRKRIEREKAHLEAAENERRTQAQTLASRLEQVSLTFSARVGEEDKLFGSVTSADIAQQLHAQGFPEIEKRQIDLHEPIKALGVYKIPVRLHADVKPEVRVWVIKQ
jgi:ribosomal protein L9